MVRAGFILFRIGELENKSERLEVTIPHQSDDELVHVEDDPDEEYDSGTEQYMKPALKKKPSAGKKNKVMFDEQRNQLKTITPRPDHKAGAATKLSKSTGLRQIGRAHV